ncbi:MAG: hypothetical protein IJU50_06805 [Lachnospiraceae bacterium]|nr:hypothetical protein [Lachnospiraceae bacterium]
MEYDDFGKIYKYLEEHGPTPGIFISKATGVRLSTVHELLESGALEVRPGDENLMDAEIARRGMERERAGQRTGFSSIQGDTGRMRYVNNADSRKIKK